jgi:hypothetical protein
MKIGDLSRELETNERVRTDLRDTSDVQTKTETLEAAGINIRTTERYEELTGGREELSEANQIFGAGWGLRCWSNQFPIAIRPDHFALITSDSSLCVVVVGVPCLDHSARLPASVIAQGKRSDPRQFQP